MSCDPMTHLCGRFNKLFGQLYNSLKILEALKKTLVVVYMEIVPQSPIHVIMF
jgi:hypothetical protein